jgi:hypothetical protein
MAPDEAEALREAYLRGESSRKSKNSEKSGESVEFVNLETQHITLSASSYDHLICMMEHPECPISKESTEKLRRALRKSGAINAQPESPAGAINAQPESGAGAISCPPTGPYTHFIGLGKKPCPVVPCERCGQTGGIPETSPSSYPAPKDWKPGAMIICPDCDGYGWRRVR